MEAKPIISALSPNAMLEIHHKGVVVPFSIRSIGKVNFQNPKDPSFNVFDQLNGYWSSLSESTQDQLFKVYENIANEIGSAWSISSMAEALIELSRQLMEFHHLEDIQSWLYATNAIILPGDLVAEYQHSVDHNTSPEKTYTRREYMDLVTMSIALRAMLPVWGEYILHIRGEIGNDFKEFDAFNLLNNSYIVQSPAMAKLKLYIERIIEKNPSPPDNVLNGITTADLPRWMLSLVVIKRLCLADVRGVNQDEHLCRLIYRLLAQRTDNTSGNFQDKVRLKEPREGTDGGMDKTSALERFKTPAPYSIGNIVELEVWLKDLMGAAEKLAMGIDPELVRRSVESAQALHSASCLDMQVTLMRWVFKHIVSPRGMMCLSPDHIINAIGVSQAVLWYRGHKYLSILQSACPITSDEGMTVSPVSSRERISQDRQEVIAKLYPYDRPNGKKQSTVKTINSCVQGIDILVEQMSMYSWRPTADEQLVTEALGSNVRRITIRSDIRNVIADLAIELGQRSWR